MRRTVYVGIVATAAATLGLGVSVPAAGAMTKPKPKADLKFTIFKPHLGRPAYAVVGTDGVLEPIEVEVQIRNQDDGPADPSVTIISFRDSNGREFAKRIRVPKLPGHSRADYTVQIKRAKPGLGFADLRGEVDATNKVHESDESNNVRRTQFAILAKEWDAKAFDTATKGVFSNDVTFIRGGFRFVLSRFDHASENWIYKVYGSVTDQASETGVCSASSNVTKSHNPWANSYLRIAADLGGYHAIVQPSSAEKYTATVTCLGIGSHTEPHTFQTLETFEGKNREPVMKPNAQQLDDEETLLKTTWKWDFRAALG